MANYSSMVLDSAMAAAISKELKHFAHPFANRFHVTQQSALHLALSSRLASRIQVKPSFKPASQASNSAVRLTVNMTPTAITRSQQDSPCGSQTKRYCGIQAHLLTNQHPAKAKAKALFF